ncbi:MAG: alkaline phosphatase family protein [Candidatus Cloacimonetes bacterium]|nr:alkaline phosphatase family protein [Candidatus Cloacimonadota bacterium]
MKRIFLIIGILLFLIVLSLVIYHYFHEFAGYEIYGGEATFSLIRETGNLVDILKQHDAGEIYEILIFDEQNKTIIIQEENLADFQVKRGVRGFFLSDLLTNTRLIDVKRIVIQTNNSHFGVYHLSYTEELSFYPIYDLIKEMIYYQGSEGASYFYGSYNPSDEVFTVPIEADSILFVYSSGEEEWRIVDSPENFSVYQELIFSYSPDQQERKLLKAIWEKPPLLSALDMNAKLKQAVGEKPTLAIFIDGLGYKLWNYAEEMGYTNSFPEMLILPMRSVFPPKTIYNYYAFGTGDLLPDNLSERKEIFADLFFSGVNGVIIEGEMQIFFSPYEQILHTKQAHYDNIDVRIFNSALEVLNDYDFVFIHFHDIDNNGHRFGPYSSEVLEAIQRTGNFITELKNRWKGSFFIFSDHGMHCHYEEDQKNCSGAHYTAQAEDIIAIFSDISEDIYQGVLDEKQ